MYPNITDLRRRMDAAVRKYRMTKPNGLRADLIAAADEAIRASVKYWQERYNDAIERT